MKSLSVIVVGASGDLAQRKILPALFSLYSRGLLPADFRLFGFARSPMDDAAFRAGAMQYLTCRYVPRHSCERWMSEFLARCFYFRGRYGERDAFLDLREAMAERGEPAGANRVFYLAIPPSVFSDTVRALGDSGLVNCGVPGGWSRVVIEKPFGSDRASSDRLTEEIARVFTEAQTYRIDHYLGKEIVQNLLVLRFANAVFEPLWNRQFIDRVLIDWSEPIGVGDRGGYYDSYGVIRDVVQNHLLQILSLVAMERPADMSPDRIRDEKVRVLRHVPPLAGSDILLGQYVACGGANPRRAYREERGVNSDSATPTYAAAVLRVKNARWNGVPFVIRAGKALSRQETAVRIRFRRPASDLFMGMSDPLRPNELVLRVQPDEAIYLRVNNKEPGLTLSVAQTDLNLRYHANFTAEIPEAYERLLLDVIGGDKSLFVRSDELAAAWDIFTPVLHSTESARAAPEPYVFGSDGPAGVAGFLAHQLGIDVQGGGTVDGER